MACFHPLKAIQYKKQFTENGKGKIRILQKEEYDRDWKDCEDYDVLALPCGQCSGCRMDYARQWANRLLLELQYHDSAYFITLTYNSIWINSPYWHENTDKAPLVYDADSYRLRWHKKKIGEDEFGDPIWEQYLVPHQDSLMPKHIEEPHVLSPVPDEYGQPTQYNMRSTSVRDVQLFMKRLRRRFPDDKIRFYAVTEYGSKNFRPHIHLIVFGLHLDNDLCSVFEKSGLGYDYVRSNELFLCWPFGNNIVAPVTWESCCYVARYMMKKQKGLMRNIYSDFGLEEPSSTMSRRPGIAFQYLKDHPITKDTYNYVIGTADGAKKFPPPRYLEKLFELDNPEIAKERRRIRRISAINSQHLVCSRTHKTYEQYLADQEEEFAKSMRALNHYRNIV